MNRGIALSILAVAAIFWLTLKLFAARTVKKGKINLNRMIYVYNGITCNEAVFTFGVDVDDVAVLHLTIELRIAPRQWTLHDQITFVCMREESPTVVTPFCRCP